jgi:hypothetical protein
MHRVTGSLLGLLFVIAFSAPSFAEPATTAPATQPSADATVLQPNDKDALAANIDKEVVVEGVIEKAEWSSTGKVMRATFKDAGESKFQAIIFVKDREKFDKAFDGDVAKALSGAKVKLKGKLQEYRNAPEMVLSDVGQITVVEPASSAAQ